jgi:polar amino acid transport system substrate-binding protein
MSWSLDPPYVLRDARGELTGIDIEIARESLQRLGCRLELREQPFARSLHSLELGELDMVPGAFKRPERETYAHFSAPTYKARKRLYLPRRALGGLRARTLRAWLAGGAILGVLPGVSYGPEFNELAGDPKLRQQFRTVVHRRSLWLMLERGRIDGMLADDLTANYELQQLQLHQAIAASPVVVASEPSFTAFSKRTTDEAFVQRYNEALHAMAREGRMNALLKRFGAVEP